MFEIKDGQDYYLYNNINTDPFTWKNYELENSIEFNRHDMLEVVLNTDDATLLGSASSVEKMN